MNGKPFLDGGMGKVFQFSTNVSVARELNPGPWRHLTTIQWKSDGADWKTLPFPPSRNGLPFNATTPGNKFHSTYFQSIKFQGTHTHVLNCASTSLIYFVGSNALQLKL